MHNRHLLTSFVRLEKQARQPLNVSALLYISPAHESLWFSPYMPPPPPPPPPPGPRDPAWTVPELRRRALQLQRPVTALLHDMSVLREFLAGIDRHPRHFRPVILIRNSVQVLAATCGRAQSSSSVSGGDRSGLSGGVKEAPTRFCRTLARQARQLVAQGELSLLMAESPSAQPSLRWACPHTGQVRSVGTWACAAWEAEVTAAAATAAAARTLHTATQLLRWQLVPGPDTARAVANAVCERVTRCLATGQGSRRARRSCWHSSRRRWRGTGCTITAPQAIGVIPPRGARPHQTLPHRWDGILVRRRSASGTSSLDTCPPIFSVRLPAAAGWVLVLVSGGATLASTGSPATAREPGPTPHRP
eukprot:COSAG01_NODE_384_length_17775_cov_186.844648_3_plen_362_part_00